MIVFNELAKIVDSTFEMKQTLANVGYFPSVFSVFTSTVEVKTIRVIREIRPVSPRISGDPADCNFSQSAKTRY